MPELVPILNKNEIDQRVTAIAAEISADYAQSDLIVIGILKGSFIFLSDLIRKLTIPVKVDFVRVSSYGTESASTEKIRLIYELESEIKNKDVLIIEDIIDTGLTISFLVEYFYSFNPKSVQVCALIDKQERKKKRVEIRYVCHVIKKGFLVGYGLDFAENYRYLPDIYHLKI
jgi:hypoxanthine phosphoribosyltransferase